MASPTLRAVGLLLKLDAHRLFGFNEFRHSRDPKARRRWRLLAGMWGFVAVSVLAYLIAMAAGMATLGLIELLPGCLYTGAAGAILFFETLRVGADLFGLDRYEQITPLPLPPAALPVSRFLGLYLFDLGMCALLLGPGLVIYAATVRPGGWFPAAALWGLLWAPLLPLAFATLLGILVALLVRRLPNKSLIAGLLLAAFAVGSVVVSMRLSALPPDLDGRDIAQALVPALRAAATAYAPAAWFGRLLTGDASAAFPLALASVLPAAAVAWFSAARYGALCQALNAFAARRARRAGAWRVHTPLHALYLREVRRYVSCTSWFSNTIVGFLLMPALGLGLLLGGQDALAALGLSGEASIRFVPVLLGLMGVLMPVTACSISLEGPYWPVIRTLPVRTRDLLLSKVLLNLSVALPCWAVGVAGGLLALRPRGIAALWLALVPALYCLFGAVAALRINLALPQLHWQTETQVVKQSASTLLALVCGFLAAGVPGLCLTFAPANTVYTAVCLVLAALTALLWRQCLRVNLQTIQ